MGERFLAGLQSLAQKYSLVNEVRGRGLFTAFTLPTADMRNALRMTCWQLGLATLSSGTKSLRFRPCLNVSPAEVDMALEILNRALASVADRH
jgi:L-lysine 6-transaminase